jgi:Cys/Met metabolism PLP-dependent enzyme
MTGLGGMIGFVLDGDAAATAAMVDRLAMFAIAPSLGGVESFVTLPVTTTHHGLDPDERTARGIADSMIRPARGQAPAHPARRYTLTGPALSEDPGGQCDEFPDARSGG